MDFPELVQRFAAAAASGNGDALADLFTPNGTYNDYFFGPSTGRDAIKQMLAHFAGGGANFRWSFFDPALTGSTGYASYRFSFDLKRPEANARARRLRRHRPLRPRRQRPHRALLGGVRPRHGAGAAGLRARAPAQDRPQVRHRPQGPPRMGAPRAERLRRTASVPPCLPSVRKQTFGVRQLCASSCRRQENIEALVACDTDHDRLVVSAHHRRKPNARLPPQDNVPNDLGRWREPDVLCHRLRQSAVEAVMAHGCSR